MRILLDQSVHDHRNQGNNSLLEIALNRFRNYWPNASYAIVSNSPHVCQVYFPGTRPVSPDTLQEQASKLDKFHRIMPPMFWRFLFELREARNSRDNSISEKRQISASGELQLRHGETDQTENKNFESERLAQPTGVDHSSSELYHSITDYDLYSATGGGYMCDSDKERLLQVFDRIEAAIAHGIPAVMVGQGVGPMVDPELLLRAREVLPRLDYILIREECNARPLLESLDVPPSKVFMTGDDAIELGYQARQDQLGKGIGLSLRVAHYTGLNQEHIDAIQPVVIEKAKRYGAELISAPIDVNDTDKHFTEQLMKGYPKTSSSWRKFETPGEIIRRVSRCRIMISGTFHGAVFALSQGIPVIGLAITDEYYKKLSGLAAEFGEKGCQVIHLGKDDKGERLSDAIDQAWISADGLRPQLLRHAERQINLGNAAYDQIFNLIEKRSRTQQFL